jgi:hypothetical protein
MIKLTDIKPGLMFTHIGVTYTVDSVGGNGFSKIIQNGRSIIYPTGRLLEYINNGCFKLITLSKLTYQETL